MSEPAAMDGKNRSPETNGETSLVREHDLSIVRLPDGPRHAARSPRVCP